MFNLKVFIIFKTLHLVLKKNYLVQKQEKNCKMKNNYPINMKIPVARLQMASNEWTIFQKNPYTLLVPQTGEMDRVKSIPPP